MRIIQAFLAIALTSCVTSRTESIVDKARKSGIIANVPRQYFQDFISTPKNNVTILEISATWCKPCQVIKPELEKIAKEKSGLYSVAIIDAEDDMDFLGQNKIVGLPAFYVWVPGREKPFRAQGTVVKEIEKILSELPNLNDIEISKLEAMVTKAPIINKKDAQK